VPELALGADELGKGDVLAAFLGLHELPKLGPQAFVLAPRGQLRHLDTDRRKRPDNLLGGSPAAAQIDGRHVSHRLAVGLAHKVAAADAALDHQQVFLSHQGRGLPQCGPADPVAEDQLIFGAQELALVPLQRVAANGVGHASHARALLRFDRCALLAGFPHHH